MILPGMMKERVSRSRTCDMDEFASEPQTKTVLFNMSPSPTRESTFVSSDASIMQSEEEEEHDEEEQWSSEATNDFREQWANEWTQACSEAVARGSDKAERLQAFQSDGFSEQWSAEWIRVLCEAAERLQIQQPAELRKRRKLGHLSLCTAVCKHDWRCPAEQEEQKPLQKSTKGKGFGDWINAKKIVWERKIQKRFKKFANRSSI